MAMADHSNASSRDLPQKLQDDLLKVNRHYKPSSNINPNINRNHPSAAAINAAVEQHIKKDEVNSVRKVLDDSQERAMYDEIFGSINRNSKPSTPPSTLPSTNADFTTSLLKRLKVVEAEAAAARAKLSEQQDINESLKKEIEHLKAFTEDPVCLLQEIKHLKEQNADLQDKIDEMENFLGDYGLVWVGNNGRQQLIKNTPTAEDDSADEQVMPFIDFDKAINELNEIIFSEPAQIMKTGEGKQKARLVQASEVVEHIRLVYYSNGLMIKNGPFRPCTSESYLSFVQDIMEGYFPSELQSEYPDGVIFDLIDKRDEIYSQDTMNSDKMSRTQFLNRLPKTIIQKGEVVDVRTDIAKRLDGNVPTSTNDGSTTGTTNGKVAIETPASKHGPEQPHALGSIVQIQIKWVDRAIFIAQMFEMSTVGDLKLCITQHIEKTNDSWKGDFELRCAFPPRVLEPILTLSEAGLTPNGTVHARKLN